MVGTTDYSPPKVWTWDQPSGGKFAAINRPVAGATHDSELPIGRHPLQLYSLGTPNGQKVTILLEELLERGQRGAEYDAWLVQIEEGEQFGSGFVAINPNAKIPALVDRSGTTPVRLFESGAILLYLAEKWGDLLTNSRAEMLSWLFWQVGAAPFIGGGFGHFYVYAPSKMEYPINRYAMEAKRQLDVLDRQLTANEFIAGSDYSIADIAVWPWYGQLALNRIYEDAGEFLAVQEYPSLQRWARQIDARPAVRRGRIVNKTSGDPHERLRERHDASDFGLADRDLVTPAVPGNGP